MANYVLIKDGRVENLIVADESFIELIKDDYDAILDHDSFPEIAHIGGVAEQLEDGKWVFGSSPFNSNSASTNDFIDAEVVVAELDAPAEEV
jgi:hypothetical protein